MRVLFLNAGSTVKASLVIEGGHRTAGRDWAVTAAGAAIGAETLEALIAELVRRWTPGRRPPVRSWRDRAS